MPEFQRETVEFSEITVRINGQVKTEGVEFCVIPIGARPSDYTIDRFAPAVILEGKTGVMIDKMTPGIYRAWWRVTSNPEIPVRPVAEPIKIL